MCVSKLPVMMRVAQADSDAAAGLLAKRSAHWDLCVGVDLNGFLKLDHCQRIHSSGTCSGFAHVGRFCSSHPFTWLGTRAAGLNTSFHHLIVFRNPFTSVGGPPGSGLEPRNLAWNDSPHSALLSPTYRRRAYECSVWEGPVISDLFCCCSRTRVSASRM